MKVRSIFFIMALMTAPVTAQQSLIESVDYPGVLPGPSNAHPGTGCFMLASGTIEVGDVDWLELTLPFASVETIIDIDFVEDGSSSILLISEENGRTVLGNGDSNNIDDNTCGLGTASNPVGSMRDSVVYLPDTQANAVIHIGVTGGGDWGFSGAHAHNFNYEVWVYATGEVAGGGCTDNLECDDGVDCTTDVCDAAAGTCTNVADDSACDNGLFCDGAEVCDAVNDCVDGDAPCSGGEVCSEDAGECVFPTGVVMDIRPGSCKNQINRKSKGVLPVVLFGSSDFDVEQVDISSLILFRADGLGGIVSPNEGPPGPHTKVKDIGAAGLSDDDEVDDDGDDDEEGHHKKDHKKGHKSDDDDDDDEEGHHEKDHKKGHKSDDDDCRKSSSEEDGLMDLVMKFKTADVMHQLELDEFERGARVELMLSGYMLDGREFSASDFVRVLSWKKPGRRGGRH